MWSNMDCGRGAPGKQETQGDDHRVIVLAEVPLFVRWLAPVVLFSPLVTVN